MDAKDKTIMVSHLIRLGHRDFFLNTKWKSSSSSKTFFFLTKLKKKQKQVASSKTQNLKMDYLKKKVEQK